MHIAITDPSSGETLGTLCIDRGAGTCYVLDANVEVLDTLVATARATRAPQIRLVVPSEATTELEALGWSLSEDLIVMTKEG